MSTEKRSHKKKPPIEEAIKVPEVKESIQAPYVFTEGEITAMSTSLRGFLQTVETLTDQKKQSAADFKLRIDGAANSIKQLRLKLDSGQETRALEALVTFDPKAGKKQFHHPATGAFIREEEMSPFDYQLPMFKPAENGEVPATPGSTDVPVNKARKSKPAKAPAANEPGTTSVGDVMDNAASKLDAPQIVLDLTKEDWEHVALNRAFKKAAKIAQWTAPQISLMQDRLRECSTVEAMIETLRPHVMAAPVTQTPEATTTDDGFPT